MCQFVMLIQMAMAGVMVIMPFYLEMVKKIPAGNAGTILLTLPVGMILTAPLAGKISDVIGTKKPIITGFVLNIETAAGWANLCAMVSLVYIVGMVFIWFCPETKGKPLPE